MTPLNRCPICRSEWYEGSPPPCDHSREEWEAHRKREAEPETDRGELLLGFIYEEVDRRLNPDDDECWYCGGEGETYDCFDGLCADAEFGCEECTRPCPECRLHAGRRAKAIREEVIKAGDPDVATAWLKSIGRWRDDITSEQVMQELADAKALLPAPPGDDKGG